MGSSGWYTERRKGGRTSMIDHLPERSQGLSPEARGRFQSVQRSFAQMCAGEDPWIPLGKFMHQFFGAFKAYRDELVRDPLTLPATMTAEQFQWAVFCAASVEYLCNKYELPCPQWAQAPGYTLKEPWYYGLGTKEKLRMATPEAFAKRNIFCGDRVFNNKYEKPERRRTA
jgi:hypothetical protein